MTGNQRRLEWLDAAKGLGILLVILGHTSLPSFMKAAIYTFHMPLFFFLSGYLFTPGKYGNFRSLLARKSKSLLAPYFCFAGLLYLWWLYVNYGGSDVGVSPFKLLLGTFLAIRNTEWTLHTGTLWFVICLFVTEMLFYLFARSLTNMKHLMLSLLAVSFVGYAYQRLGGNPLPWSMDAAFIALLFYGCGYWYQLHQQALAKYIRIGSLFILLFVNVLLGFLNGWLSGSRVDMFSGSYGNYILFVGAALSGIAMFVVLIRLIRPIAPLQYFGRHSLIYLALHMSIIFYGIDRGLEQLTRHFPSLGTALTESSLIGFVYTAATAIIAVPMIALITRWLPFMLGRSYSNEQAHRASG